MLPPLGADHLGALSRRTLRTTRPRRRLAAWCADKTGGNPFFVTQFLRRCIRTAHLFDPWPRVAGGHCRPCGTPLTDNVVDLMAREIGRLAPRHAARPAAGGLYRQPVRSRNAGDGGSELRRRRGGHLWAAVEQGLVLAGRSRTASARIWRGRARPAGAFRFLHDRVQQAAYALIPEAGRPKCISASARLLLALRGGRRGREGLFDVVNHLNYGAT